MRINNNTLLIFFSVTVMFVGISCQKSNTKRGTHHSETEAASVNFKNVKQATLEDIMADAVVKDKLVFIDFYTTWCGPCKWMDNNVFNQNDLAIKLNRHFINYKVDAEDFDGVNTALKYRVSGYPTYIFLTPQGKILHTLEGMIPKDTFTQTIDELIVKTSSKL